MNSPSQSGEAMATNGSHKHENGLHSRPEEVDDLVTSVQQLIVKFIRTADEDAETKCHGHGKAQPGEAPRTSLVEYHPPQKLDSLFSLDLPATPGGKDQLLSAVRGVLAYSVNTWDQGFLDKLYGATNAPGVAAELVLAALNTNVHVYGVSPALTVVEKRVTRRLARLFGFEGRNAGGIAQPGGSAGNATSIVVARNNLFPDTKTKGLQSQKFILFTSAHGHYSLEKAGQMFGFGSDAVRGVPVDAEGRMQVDQLRKLVTEARKAGEEPFYVNATAGTTVLGSFERFDEIADVCRDEGLWMHVDGSWGGPVAFSQTHKHKLKGVERADSVAVTPHKMLGVPMTCSFLLVQDVRKLHKAMTLPAGYLFHSADGNDDEGPAEFWDLADLTPQCGRRGDALKLALGWIYYGSEGYERLIDSAFDTAAYMAKSLDDKPAFDLVSQSPPPCWQVCFYYHKKQDDKETNSRTTETIAGRLVRRGFMVDYAPGEQGKFFRVVVNGQTRKDTVDGLLKAVEDVGSELGL